jgi:DNA replication and repair protein RecF
MRLESLRLTNFRSYRSAELLVEGRSAYLFGPNGAGKTNLLEAISFLSPGRGLRNAPAAEVGWREAGVASGADWAVAAQLAEDEDLVRIGTGSEGGGSRRLARFDGEPVAVGRLAEVVRPLWMTPAQDRLFLDAAGDRRRFFDRLVFAAEPVHAVNVARYEKALRERGRLLAEERWDPAWAAALEDQLALYGARIAEARSAARIALQDEIDRRVDSSFPRAGLALTGEWETLAETAPQELEARLREAFASGRARDAAAGRALAGPHRGDLAVTYREKNRPAAEGSTGEQKALILNLILAQAARLSRAQNAPNPVLLLDEVAAHLDRGRRQALFDEIEALALQAFLTGTDETLFDSLQGRALGVSVDAGVLQPLD